MAVHGIGPELGSSGSKQYHIGHNGKQFGPLSLLQVSQRRLTDDMVVWIEGEPDWVPIASVPELAPYVQRSIASRPVVPPPVIRIGRAKPPDPAIPPPPVISPVIAPPPSPPPPPSRLAKAMGVIHLLLGITGILATPIPAIVWALEREGPLAEAIDYPAFWEIQVFFMVVGFLLSLLLLFGGIGLLKRLLNGRTLSLVYGVAGIVVTLLATVFNVFGVMLPLMDAADMIGTEDAHNTAIGYALFSSLGMCGGIYPIIVLVVMNLRSVKESLS